ncbi:MAG: c-type cytochrome biogenesis protein CcmI, partial [Caulobacteraceae bacterium]
ASPVDVRLGPFPLLAAATTPVLAAVAIYLAVGSPGLTDQPFADRLRAWRANPERYDAPELAAALRSLAQSRPDDPEPWRRLAGLDLSLGDADGAAHALRRALAIAPGRSDLMAPLGEIMVLKARGSVDPDARAIFMQVLRRDPTSPTARYYLARAAIASGDTVGGLATWRGLLADLAPDDPRRGLLAKEVATVERTGALPPPAAAGAAPPPGIPDAIRGMVDGLAARLRAHPDDPDGWVRLVRAYAVLGETGRRDAALAFARGRYADRPALLGQLTAAAAAPRMGSAPP